MSTWEILTLAQKKVILFLTCHGISAKKQLLCMQTFQTCGKRIFCDFLTPLLSKVRKICSAYSADSLPTVPSQKCLLNSWRVISPLGHSFINFLSQTKWISVPGGKQTNKEAVKEERPCLGRIKVKPFPICGDYMCLKAGLHPAAWVLRWLGQMILSLHRVKLKRMTEWQRCFADVSRTKCMPSLKTELSVTV